MASWLSTLFHFFIFFRHYHYVVIFITVTYILGSIYRHEVIPVWLVYIHMGFFLCLSRIKGLERGAREKPRPRHRQNTSTT